MHEMLHASGAYTIFNRVHGMPHAPCAWSISWMVTVFLGAGCIMTLNHNLVNKVFIGEGTAARKYSLLFLGSSGCSWKLASEWTLGTLPHPSNPVICFLSHFPYTQVIAKVPSKYSGAKRHTVALAYKPVTVPAHNLNRQGIPNRQQVNPAPAWASFSQEPRPRPRSWRENFAMSPEVMEVENSYPYFRLRVSWTGCVVQGRPTSVFLVLVWLIPVLTISLPCTWQDW